MDLFGEILVVLALGGVITLGARMSGRPSR
jgi:hypothetical protein